MERDSSLARAPGNTAASRMHGGTSLQTWTAHAALASLPRCLCVQRRDGTNESAVTVCASDTLCRTREKRSESGDGEIWSWSRFGQVAGASKESGGQYTDPCCGLLASSCRGEIVSQMKGRGRSTSGLDDKRLGASDGLS